MLFLSLVKLLLVFFTLPSSLGHEQDVLRVVVEKGSTAMLPCSLNSPYNIVAERFHWKKDGVEVYQYDAGIHSNSMGDRPHQDEQFKGRVFHFPEQLKNGNASLNITNTKVADSGTYTCALPLLQPNKQTLVELAVVAAPKLLINQCNIQGANPKPEVEWRDSAGSSLPAEETHVSKTEDSYNVTLQTTVTRPGRFRYVAIQEEISRVTDAEITLSDVLRVVVEKGSTAMLPCSLNSPYNIVAERFHWKKDGVEVYQYDAGIHSNSMGDRPHQDEQFKGRVFHFPEQLKNGNASLNITNTKVADSGTYTCALPLLQPNKQTLVELAVVAAPKLLIKAFGATVWGVLLQCNIQGANPKPEVEWRDSAGSSLPAEEIHVSKTEDSYNVTLQTTVTRPGRFRCVAIQEEISRVTDAEITLSEKLLEDPSTTVTITFFAGLFFGAFYRS